MSDYKLDRELIIIDLETTGTVNSEHGIIQLGAVKVNRRGVPDYDNIFNVYIQEYGKVWDEEAFKVHGITKSFLKKNGIPLADSLIKFHKWLVPMGDKKPTGLGANKLLHKNFYLGQWGANFDVPFLERAYKDCDFKFPFTHKVFDIASFVRLCLIANGELGKKMSLNECAKALLVPIEKNKLHNAAYDAALTTHVFERVVEDIQLMAVLRNEDKKFREGFGNYAQKECDRIRRGHSL